MKNRIFTGWTFSRWFYLGIGALVLVMAGIEKEWTLALAGLYFASMAIFSFGCAAGNCAVPSRKFSVSSNETLPKTPQP